VERNTLVAGFLLKLGEAALQSGHAAQAEEYFRQAAEFDHENAAAWVSLAEAQKRLGRGEAALASLGRAWDLADRVSPPPAVRAQLFGLRGLALLAESRWAEAINDLADAVELGNREWTVLRGLLDAYWRTAQYRKSMAMIAFHPNLAGRVIEHLFPVEGRCECCGRCCRKLYLVWNGDAICSEAALAERWRTDPRTTRLRPIRQVGRRSFGGLPLPSAEIWEALLAGGYIDASGATQVKYLQSSALELPGLPLAPAELARVREIIDSSPILTAHGGEFLFHCAFLGEDNRCGDHEHRLLLCREFPTARTILQSGCGYHLCLSDDVRRIEVPSLFRLAGWYALEHGLHREFLPHAREFLGQHTGHRDRENLAAIHELAAECCRRVGDELAARDHVEQAAALSAPRSGPAGGSPGNGPSPPPR
jgi:tetratricopeptide (TPR) repeat protein